MSAFLIRSLLRSLFLTILLETGAAFVIGIREWKDLLIVSLAQVVTNPLLVLISLAANLMFGLRGRTVSLLLLEPCAVAAEWLLYRRSLRYSRIRPFLLSLLLNGISFAAGEILNHLI